MSKAGIVSSLAFLLTLSLAFSLQAAISDSTPQSTLPRPSKQQQPQDVVRIVIEALARNDEPFKDAGIATTFAFASPANKANTGPFPKFARMVKNPVYGVMINHVERDFSEVVTMGNKAYQMVKIKAASGTEVIFAFRLSQQLDGEYAGMWMTDAVWPVETGEIPEQAF